MKFRKILAVISFALALPLFFSAQYAHAADKTVAKGTQVWLKWTITNAQTCDATVSPSSPYVWSGDKNASDGPIGITFTADTVGVYTFSCAVSGGNTSAVTLTVTSTDGGPCSYNSATQGQLQWGTGNACKARADYAVTTQSGGTATAPNITSGYNGSLNYLCNNGAWELVSSPCAPDNTSSQTPAACGADNGQTLNRNPINLCAPGTASSILPNIGGHAYTWTCSSGNVTSCWANSAGVASCGSTHYSCIPPSATSASNAGGTAGPWTWRCIGGDNIPIDCRENRGGTGVGATAASATTVSPPSRCSVAGVAYYGCSGGVDPGSMSIGYNICRETVSTETCQYGCDGGNGTGSGTCKPPPLINFVPFWPVFHRGLPPVSQATGELMTRPMLVRRGDPTWLYWNVENALCTVTGNGQSWSSPTCGEGLNSCGIGTSQATVGNAWNCISGFNNETYTSCYWHEPVPVYDALGVLESVIPGYTDTVDARFFSGAGGQQSPPVGRTPAGIQGHTDYTLRCTSLSGVALPDQVQPVDIAPIWLEQ